MEFNSFKKVTHEEAISIIEHRIPLGKFWEEDEGIYVAIDNSTGDVWTEDFSTKEECFKYLSGDNSILDEYINGRNIKIK